MTIKLRESTKLYGKWIVGGIAASLLAIFILLLSQRHRYPIGSDVLNKIENYSFSDGTYLSFTKADEPAVAPPLYLRLLNVGKKDVYFRYGVGLPFNYQKKYTFMQKDGGELLLDVNIWGSRVYSLNIKHTEFGFNSAKQFENELKKFGVPVEIELYKNEKHMVQP